MVHAQTPTPIENKFLSLAGVAGFCFAVLWVSPMSVIARLLSYDQSFFILRFEEHFWQFVLSFVAVVILSRGHLWSYGINSQNLKVSMIWLGWLYGGVVIVTVSLFLSGMTFLPADPMMLPTTTAGTVVVMLVYWMASPIANQILFFGFGQTILMKHWGDAPRIAGIPITVIIISILFTAGATASQFYQGQYSFVPTLFLGVYSGVVYWKTNSLITPMLAHAFYFGFPLFVYYLMNVARP